MLQCPCVMWWGKHRKDVRWEADLQNEAAYRTSVHITEWLLLYIFNKMKNVIIWTQQKAFPNTFILFYIIYWIVYIYICMIVNSFQIIQICWLEKVDKSRVFWVKATTNSNLKITNNIECILSSLWGLLQQRGTYAWNNIFATMLWNTHLACICHWWGNYGWKCNCGNNEILYVDTNPGQICQGSKELKYHTGGVVQPWHSFTISDHSP